MGWLPGPTTIFLASSMAASPSSQINIGVLFILFFIAATLAWIKKYIQGLNDRMNFHGKIKKDLTVVEKYFRDNEKTALLLGRFIPVVDLFVPILAGQARMKFKTFCLLNLSGTLIWLLAYSLSGYFLGGVTFIAKHFSIMILIVIFLPTVSHYGYEFCLEIKKHHSEREQF
jgi:membrane-associated protein